MTVILDRPVTTEPPAPDAVDVVRRARRAPLRHHRRLVAGLVVVLAEAVRGRSPVVPVPDGTRA